VPFTGESHIIEVALRPGVTDPVADQIVRTARVLGIHGIERASSGQRFAVCGERLSAQDLHQLAQRLLANPTIHRYALGEIEPAFPHPAQASSSVEVIPIRELPDEGLLSLSQAHLAALDLHEMRTIQEYFQQQERDLTDVEFETLAQTWSEHCVHKTFRSDVRVTRSGRVVDGAAQPHQKHDLHATRELAKPWCISVFRTTPGSSSSTTSGRSASRSRRTTTRRRWSPTAGRARASAA
jgi:phosphoribosylformylglycinamidine (FGAM) synthase PurS component